MSVNHLFPVVCTADLPSTVVDAFLTRALNGSEALVPNTEPCLVVLTSPANSPNSAPTHPSRTPTQPFTSPFNDQSPTQIAEYVGGAGFFAVLDARSAEGETALLVQVQRDGREETKVDVLRITFDAAQHVLQALDVASLGFEELMINAEDQGGVYGRPPQRKSPLKGGPAPRKKLGG
ncbi:uncharacterized protein K452DRAFT_339826 [Aplosporella prunicola CBS 121167]|uniref:Uncharacterized protein n=1 Tax=Aplosporella prunicola CBS 121167 TaxID=1176127 RepID=A0A6A6B393_9PEZI|nr:uncharacterized protein K452DRAFT_339826 [Aplosporella prunicola CBS 121167]KAF2137725.1 hypothetical protein K452DRAFT_339826 [Aplosporella prunicola CBS 121167]